MWAVASLRLAGFLRHDSHSGTSRNRLFRFQGRFLPGGFAFLLRLSGYLLPFRVSRGLAPPSHRECLNLQLASLAAHPSIDRVKS